MPNRYLVDFQTWGSHAAAAVSGVGGQVLMEFPGLRGVAARMSPQAAQALERNPVVSFVEVDPHERTSSI